MATSAGALGTRFVLLPSKNFESKEVLERHNGWFEASFMPAWVFTFRADFPAQLGDWLQRANTRPVRTLVAVPVDLPKADRAGMLARLPASYIWAGARGSVSAGTATCGATPATTPLTRP